MISDWGAVNDPSLSLEAGLDLEMPASHGVSAAKIRQDLKSGRLSEAALDKAVRRVWNWWPKPRKPRPGRCSIPAITMGTTLWHGGSPRSPLYC